MYAPRRAFLCSLLVLLVALPFSFTKAETLTSTERAQLEAQLAEVQTEQAQAQSALTVAASKSSSLQNDIKLLAAKIKTEQLAIQAETLLLKTLGDNIQTKQSEIDSLAAQIAQNKTAIAQLFRQTQVIDASPLATLAFTDQTLSGLFNDEIEIEIFQQSITTLSAQLATAEASSTAAKAVLVNKQNATSDALYAIQQTQTTLRGNETQQTQLLSISKNNEKSYSALVAEKKKEANAISAKLFALAGGSNPIPFGEAYQYALSAQKATGIDPAFLLAILTQESNLGTNQGNCYLANTSTGAGVSMKTGKVFANVMNPKSIPQFLQITTALQVDPLHTIISCPQSIGFGGAMGPAQFIASTWMLFSSRIASALGFTGIANPWNPQHAFMASAFYLTDLGAGAATYTAESNAACRYYSGSPCSKSALVASYGTNVLSLASTIQTTEINRLQGL
jgi:membrane-bound lytic murein transglycosylase B